MLVRGSALRTGYPRTPHVVHCAADAEPARLLLGPLGRVRHVFICQLGAVLARHLLGST